MNLQWQKTAQQRNGKKFGLVKSQGVFSGGAEPQEEDASSGMKKAMESARRKAEAKAKEEAAKALKQDASIFDYDGVYETMERERRVGAAPSQRTARYIPKLQEAAKLRDIDFDRVYERQLLKEEENSDLPAEKYVTAAYKKQLQESRKWDAEDAKETSKTERATTGSMHGFYANLMTKNIAVGADLSAAVSAYTHGSERHKRMVASPDDASPPPPPAGQVQVQVQVKEEPRIKDDEIPELPPPEEPPKAPSTKVPSRETAAPEASVEDVNAARERFLARKKARLAQ